MIQHQNATSSKHWTPQVTTSKLTHFSLRHRGRLAGTPQILSRPLAVACPSACHACYSGNAFCKYSLHFRTETVSLKVLAWDDLSSSRRMTNAQTGVGSFRHNTSPSSSTLPL